MNLLPWDNKQLRVARKINNNLADGTEWLDTGLILGLRPPNERQGYFIKTSLIGWAQT